MQTQSAVAHQIDDDADRRTPSCQVRLYIDEYGTTTASADIILEKPIDLVPEHVEEALCQALGTPLSDVGRTKTRTRVMVQGRADRAFPPDGSHIDGALDPGPLGRLLRPLGIETIEVWVMWSPTYPDRRGPLKGQLQFYSVPLSSPELIKFGLQIGASSWARFATSLAVLFIAPILVALWRRWIALRAVNLEPAVRWYRFWRWLHWITLATWLIWLTVMPALDIRPPLPWSVWHTVGTAMGVQFAVMLLPPGLVMLLCRALAEDVFGRLTQAPQPTWEISRRVAAALVTIWLPLVLVIIGAMALSEMHFRAGVAWFVAAGATRVVGLRLMQSGEDLTPHAVSVGELRDRIFALARQAGVLLKQLYVVPSGKTPQANAFAVKGGNVFITEHLLRSLTRREVDGVAAHELAHLKYRHPQWLTGLFFAALFVPDWLLQLFVPFWWNWSWMQYLPIGVLFAFGLLYFVSRRFEYQTDSYAAWLTGDPEALITGLVKVHRLNLLPMKWGRWEEGLVTHPSTSLRLEAIARQNGISRQRLEEIVQHPEPDGERYSTPEAIAEPGLVFSSAFKIKWTNRITYARLGAMLLTPTLVAYLAWNLEPEGMVKWAMCLGGIVLTFTVLVVLDNFAPLWSYAEIRRGLEEKMKALGADWRAWSGTFVSFAPDAIPRLYENQSAWDFGLLFFRGTQLFYLGEQARFALPRKQIVSVQWGRGVSRWWHVPYVYVTWRDDASGADHTFNLRAAEANSMRQLKGKTVLLDNKLRMWLKQSAPDEEIPAFLSQVPPLHICEVTSAPVQLKYTSLVLQTGIVFLLGMGVSLLFGLPYRPEESGWTWYVPAVGALAFWFEMLPVVIFQERARMQSSYS